MACSVGSVKVMVKVVCCCAMIGPIGFESRTYLFGLWGDRSAASDGNRMDASRPTVLASLNRAAHPVLHF